MTVTTTSLGASVTRTLLDQSTKLSAALNASAPATSNPVGSTNSNAGTVASSADVDTSALSQSPTVSFRLAALNVALSGSTLDTVNEGASQVSLLLGQLQSLATQASSGDLSESELTVLNGQFQALRLAINNVPPAPSGTSYTAAQVTQNVPTSGNVNPETVLGGFNDTALLGNANLQTNQAAQQASSTVATASNTIAQQLAVIQSLQSDVDFAGASVDTAVQNREALNSILNASDFSETGASTTLATGLQANPAATVAAQTAKLPDNILQLLQS